MRTVATLVLVASLPLTACTHWSTSTSYAPPRETGRRLIGSPAIAESKSSQVAASFAGRSGGGTASGGLGGSMESVTLKHCVQNAEVSFDQQYMVEPTIRGRGWDVAGAVVLGILGLSAIDAGSRARDDSYPGSTSTNSGTNNYIAGAVLLGAGVGLIAYAYGVVPNRSHAPAEQRSRQFVENRLVEAEGCNVGGGELTVVQSPVPLVVQPAQGPQQKTPAERLEQLDKLHAAGQISDADYQRKRKEIIDSL